MLCISTSSWVLLLNTLYLITIKEKREGQREREREGSTKGKGGLNKNLQIPTLPPKWPRSGITFHFKTEQIRFVIFCIKFVGQIYLQLEFCLWKCYPA